MKYILIVILVSLVAMLGCTPAPKETPPESPEIENTDLAASKAEYKPGTWTEDWALALATAKTTNLPMLVNFTGSDWCSWCIRLNDEVFSRKEFQDYATKNLILVKLDFPRRAQQSEALKTQNQKLQGQFGVQGYPTIVLVNEEGKEIQRTGYQPGGAEKYVLHLQELLKPEK